MASPRMLFLRRCRTTLSAPYFVRVKTSAVSTSGRFKISTSKSRFAPWLTNSMRWSTVSAALLTRATSTRTGSVRMVLDSFTMLSGMVALKNKLCRFSGSMAMTRRMSWMNPMSSMVSASSKTKNSIHSSDKSPWLHRSSSRPGVATKTSAPFRSWFTCRCWLTPPKIKAVLTLTFFA